ncbi:MAG: toxin [Aliivibrio sp.]|uniref:zonular occludens toxin domain-containing protein n=1 Tax=Aliivibrio sp. TaxID=1872443 RepID=UPI001A526C8C|nr:toxin [Aliivibrio sp.]
MITIRTGGNGSYKSAYTAWFTILPALKAGRVVVTNIEGMETLEVIQERLQIEFPPTAKIIRIFSRDGDGVFLWQHFFCWCPLDALIVIDECQDLYSKNIGFDFRKIKAKPLSDFLEFLPSDYEDFFHSRHLPVDMDNLKSSETDDRGRAEYDENGRIVYPNTFNEGFMRHRKYNWDIELLSPDWQQIDSSIKACAEQAFYQKSRDKFFLFRRKPFIFQHPVTCTKPVLPIKKSSNLFTQKVPVEAHLLYSSTGTGKSTKSGGLNIVFKSPKILIIILIGLFSMGYFIYGFINLFIEDESQNSELAVAPVVVEDATKDTVSTETISASVDDVRSSGDSGQVIKQVSSRFLPVTQVLYFEGLERAYITGFHGASIKTEAYGLTKTESNFDIVIKVYTKDGQYSINKKYLEIVDVDFELIDECLLILTHGNSKSMITCEPVIYEDETDNSIGDSFITADNEAAITENSYLL